MSTESTQRPLAIPLEALRSVQRANELYEAAFHPSAPGWRRRLKGAWTVVGLGALVWLAWRGTFASPYWTVLRAVVLVEAVGYAYHRFFQHVGWFTRKGQVFRRNQRYHWLHHMVIYPIGRFYRRPVAYISSEGGLGLSWAVPALATIGLALATHGFNWMTGLFVGAIAAYAYFVIDDVHERFHLVKHSCQGLRYFRWLEDIHVLHHWDQRTNFTIVHPAMDWLFGTYLAPRTHRRELAMALEDNELTVSDLINWRYLLVEAAPAEYAAFISEAKRHPRSLRKIGHLMEILSRRLDLRPGDVLAKTLQTRARELLALVNPA